MNNKKKENNYIKDKEVKSLKERFNFKLFGIIICILFFVSFFLYFNLIKENNVISTQTYDIIRNAQDNDMNDNLVEKTYSSKSYLILKFPLKITTENNALNFLMIIIFIVSLFMINKLIPKTSILLLIVPFTPIFIQFLFIINDYTFSLFSALICVYSINQKNKYFKFIMSLLFSLISFFFNPYIGLIVIIYIVTYLIKNTKIDINYKKKKRIYFSLYLIPILITTFIKYETTLTTTNSFVELNSIYGVSLNLILIAIIGYNKFKRNIYLRNLALAGFAIFFIDKIAGILVLNIILLIIVSNTIKSIIDESWNNINLQKLTILLLFCTIIFSNVLHLSFINNNQTDNEIIETLKEFSKFKASTVISSKENGYIIKYFSNKNIILDSEETKIQNYKEKILDINNLFLSRNIDTTSNLLKKYNISHIIITEDMVKNEDNVEKYNGILFLIDVYRDNFKPILKRDKITIYKFIKK